MRAEVECIRPGAGRAWTFQVRTADTFEFAWHAHDAYELVVVVEGTGRRYAGDGAAPYRPGDIAIFGPHLPHTYVSDAGCSQVADVAHFTQGVAAEWTAAGEFGGVRSLLGRAANGVAVVEATTTLLESARRLATTTGARQTLSLLDLLLDLADNPTLTTLATTAPGRSVSPASADALTAVVAYLDRHFREPVVRDDVATATALAPSSVSRLMRRHLGTTLTDYVVSLRVAAACRELTENDAPIASIAHRCGFTNLANFNRHFRRARHMTPREYRRAFMAGIAAR